MLRRIFAIAVVVAVPACNSEPITGPAAEVAVRTFQPIVGETAFPLIFLDGQEISAVAARQIAAERIESIEVVKGPAAIGIYGPRASVGVILMRSKAAVLAPAR